MSMRPREIREPKRRGYGRRAFILLGGTAIALIVIYFSNLMTTFGILSVFGITPEFPQPAPVVSTVVVEEQPWQPALEVVGTLSPNQGADLAFEVPGVVEEVYFESGGHVEEGAPLARLRATDETARLQTLQASAELAAATHARNERLLDIQGISTAEVEQSEAALTATRAQVAEQRAVIEKKIVQAPFAGQVGIRRVNVGQYVNAGTPVTTLQDFDTIHFDFTVPQQALERLSVGQRVSIRVDAHPNTKFEGEIATIDPKVDTATRNVAVRAVLPNLAGKLLPGMYGTASIDTGSVRSYLTVPQTAITYNPYGNTVYLVEEVTEDGQTHFVATQTFVTTGETRGDQVAVLSGIEGGDEIVSAGQFKLQNGMTIEINNEVQPTNDPDPRPIQR